jgi:WhiB family redox-sensing transcriptional regulator
MVDTERLPPPLATHWDWQTEAACRGMGSDAFFHPPAERNTARRKRIAAAKAICRTCPAITECLSYALRVREPYGVWGGRSEDERGPSSSAWPLCGTPLPDQAVGTTRNLPTQSPWGRPSTLQSSCPDKGRHHDPHLPHRRHPRRRHR